MAGTVTFNVGQVRRLFEHSKAATEHSASFEHLFDAQYHKGGKILCDDGSEYKKGGKGWPSGKNIDAKLVPACLELVGDDGIYLMSNGAPAQLVEEGKSRRVVAYAKESDPTSKDDDWYDAKVRIFGGDDGTVPLPIAMFEAVMGLPDDATFKVKITARNITVLSPKPKAEPVRLAAGMKVRFGEPVKFKSGLVASLFRVDSVKDGLFAAIDEQGVVLGRCRLGVGLVRDCIRGGTAKIVA